MPAGDGRRVIEVNAKHAALPILDVTECRGQFRCLEEFLTLIRATEPATYLPHGLKWQVRRDGSFR